MLINFLFFQAGWFACVLGAANSMFWLGPFVVLVVSFYYFLVRSNFIREFFFILIVSFIGLFWENLIIAFDIVQYPSGKQIIGLAPLWIVAMWISFSTTIDISLSWLNGRKVLSTLFGFIGGPLAFYGGEKLGAVDFPDRDLSFLVLAIGWGVIFPLLFYISNSLDKFFIKDN